jgi:hypothetical protein
MLTAQPRWNVSLLFGQAADSLIYLFSEFADPLDDAFTLVCPVFDKEGLCP